MNNNKCNNSMVGNNLDFIIDGCSCELRADVILENTVPMTRLWGQIKDSSNRPVPNSLINLIKVIVNNDMCTYVCIAHTTSDCLGFYQFDVPAKKCNESYKLIASNPVNAGRKSTIVKNNHSNNNNIPIYENNITKSFIPFCSLCEESISDEHCLTVDYGSNGGFSKKNINQDLKTRVKFNATE